MAAWAEVRTLSTRRALTFNGASGAIVSVGFGLDNEGASLEIGSANDAQPYYFTVDVGVKVDLGAGGNELRSEYMKNNGTVSAPTPGTGDHLLAEYDILNYGTISNVDIMAYSRIRNAGAITLAGNTMGGSPYGGGGDGIANAGLIVAGAGHDTLTLNVAGAGSIEIATGAALKTQQVSSAQTIDFMGSGASLLLTTSSLDSSHQYGATIKDFGAGDAIDFYATITSASYAAGHLTLADNGSLVAILTLGGDYSAATFTATQKTGYTTINVA